MWRRDKDINRILDEDISKRRFDERLKARAKHREKLEKLEKEDLPKDAYILPKKNLKSFLTGGLVTVLALLVIGGAYATWFLGTNQLDSDVTTGTAPFVIASTTKVTNLNADLLDGLSSADLQDAPTDWTCTIRTDDSFEGASSTIADIDCSGSEKVIAGGCEANNGAATIKNAPGGESGTSQGWACQFDTIDSSHRVWANCCS